MQKIATNIFVYASILFAILGTLIALTEPKDGGVLTKIFMIDVFIILSSFALSIAGKYLNGSK